MSPSTLSLSLLIFATLLFFKCGLRFGSRSAPLAEREKAEREQERLTLWAGRKRERRRLGSRDFKRATRGGLSSYIMPGFRNSARAFIKFR